MAFWSGGMHKVILCISLMINLLSTNSAEQTKIEKIEYNNYSNDLIELKITILSKKKDLIEMQVCFFDTQKNKLDDVCYSSAVEVENRKKTTAKIEKSVKENMYLNIIFVSQNKEEKIKEIMFPIYVNKIETCYISRKHYCKSTIPSKVVYENDKINQYYDEISLINKENNYYSHNNLMPIQRIKINSRNEVLDGFANLYIYKQVSDFHIYYDKQYTFPLKIKLTDIISFEFENYYYLDLLKGITYENYQFDTIKENQIVFPYKNNEYDIKIEIIDCFYILKTIEVDFKVLTRGDLMGDCIKSKYCLRRIY